MPRNPKEQFDPEQIFKDLAFDLNSQFATGDTLKTIVEFIETEIDHEKWGIELNVRQWALLKAFYGLELSIEEESILESWSELDRSTWTKDHPQFQALVVEAGRRAGKSSLSSVIVCYEFYKLCHLPSPQKHYGIAASTPISILVLATSAQQAKRTIFKQVVGMMRVCTYFKRLIEQGRIFIGQEEIRFEEKLLYIFAGNSQSSGQVGQSVIVLVMDEAARFKDVDGDNNALELWSNIGVSGVTFGSDAKRIAISSAWYDGDAIQVLYNNSKNDPSWMGLRLRTWDLNPKASRDNPLIASEYNLNPRSAALEFEGVRFAAEDCFFDPDEVKRCFQGRSVIQTRELPVGADGLVKSEIVSIEPAGSYTTALHIDPSVVKDAYALVFGHSETRIVPGTVSQTHTVVVIDGVMLWRPSGGAMVSITNVQQCILAINQVRPIRKVTADHHNSSETIERIRMHGIPAEAMYFSNKLQLQMYENVRLLMHENRLILPREFQYKHVVLDEGVRVQLIKGQKIDHPPDSGKDTWDAIAGVAWQLVGRTGMAAGVAPTALSCQPNTAGQSSFNKESVYGNSRRAYLSEFGSGGSRSIGTNEMGFGIDYVDP